MSGSSAHLAGVLSKPVSGALVDGDTYRKYGASLLSKVEMAGLPDWRASRVIYEVGRRRETVGEALARRDELVVSIDASYETPTTLADDFAGLARKYSNFSGTFDRANLAGVVERLAKGLATRSAYAGEVGTVDLRGGNALVVNALGAADAPVSAHNSTVFIPRLVDGILAPNVFSVLCSAVAGEGGDVATDIVEVDVNRAPVVREVTGDAFFSACVDALRLLGANFAYSGVGDLFGYAVVRGMHSVVSVVGHTDEGGILRDILRLSSFTVPYGGIHYKLGVYTGLPALVASNPVTWASYVDAIALKSAALVAHCDPGIVYNDAWFPTVFMAGVTSVPVVRPGGDQAGTAQMSGNIRAQLISDLPRFAVGYCSAIAKLFGYGESSGLAARHMGAAVGLLAADPRHLRYASVAPYFWIEPTSLVPHNFTGLSAETEGFASLAGGGETLIRPGFERIIRAGGDGINFCGYIAKFRGARTSPLLLHLNGHPADGLGAIAVQQLDPNGIIHPGALATHQDVRDRVEAALPISDYLWKRGQSPLCAPSEFLNLGQTVGLMIKHLSFDETTGAPDSSHTPLAREMTDCEVEFTAAAPSGMAAGALGFEASTARRARTRAVAALASAIMKARILGSPEIYDLPILTTAPEMPGITCNGLSNLMPDPVGHISGGAGARTPAVRAPAAPAVVLVPTTPRQPVEHHGAATGPRVQPGVRVGGAGGRARQQAAARPARGVEQQGALAPVAPARGMPAVLPVLGPEHVGPAPPPAVGGGDAAAPAVHIDPGGAAVGAPGGTVPGPAV